ncbi:MAG TPA: ubiquitin-like small modifier protein 1 [Chloroflexota bacterium]
MSVRVRIPSPLRSITGGAAEVTVAATGSLAQVLSTLEEQYPGLGQRLRVADGGLNRFINVYVNGEDVRFLQGLDTPLKEGDEVSIVPAVAGGRA